MARRRTKQRIAYVLPLPAARAGHRLGINKLVVDAEQSILYTGGRDGFVCAWDLHLPFGKGQGDTVSSATAAAAAAPRPTTFRQHKHPHLHWINDIALVHGGSTIASASSDMTIRMWRPDSHAEEDDAKLPVLGKHTDYIKCLASPGIHADWLASGGLDHKIHLWDVNGAGERLSIHAGEDAHAAMGSVYTLAVRGSLLASGGPDSVLRVWDHRSGERVTSFLGHTDNLRSILISDAGDTFMSASSDQTIKLWSMTAGRCMHTLTMHNDSVWSLFSDHPQLKVFYSGDRSGLVAKTDLCGTQNPDDGVSVAVAHENSGINHLLVKDGHIWTATASSSINRWADVDTTAEIQTPESPRQNRLSGLASRPKVPMDTPAPVADNTFKIPLTSVLKITNTPAPRNREADGSIIHGIMNGRKLSEAIIEPEIDLITPIRSQPEDTVEGLPGLIKCLLLNDRRRALTSDDAGETVLWDLLNCVPIKSFGKRHLEDVAPLVNTDDVIQNWCNIDTRLGCLSVVMHEGNAFDAELYADETEFKDSVEFREDQRINIGKWIARYLFAGLIDEEIRRDEEHRAQLRETLPSNDSLRANAPRLNAGQLNGHSQGWQSDMSDATPRPVNGSYPMTPGLTIGVATPGPAGTAPPLPGTVGEDSSKPRVSGDYFSSSPPAVPALPSAETTLKPSEAGANDASTTAETPASPSDKAGSRFGKKFRMNMTFPKKFTRSAAEPKTLAAADEKASEEESDKSSEKEDGKLVDDNFSGVIQKIRNEYEEKLAADPTIQLAPGVTPSLPNDTPVLKPPLETIVVIQEVAQDQGGVADLYRGTVKSAGADADEVERVAPMWIGELLLRNQVPPKDVSKQSFILMPWEDKLPGIAGPDGNSRLNANRMLRAKKVLSYVTERIDPQPSADGDAAATIEGQANALKPEEYMELYCQDKLIPPNMTLAMIRTNVWKSAADIPLHYKSTGAKPELESRWAAEKERRAAAAAAAAEPPSAALQHEVSAGSASAADSSGEGVVSVAGAVVAV